MCKHLNRSIKQPRQPPKKAPFDRVRNLCRIIKAGPSDMSTNPKHTTALASKAIKQPNSKQSRQAWRIRLKPISPDCSAITQSRKPNALAMGWEVFE
jgi:hypothetical protein